MKQQTLAEKWMEKKVNIQALKEKIEYRVASKDFGFNEEKTQWGIFLQDVISDSYTRWTTVELAYEFGLVSQEVKDFLYEKDLFQDMYEKQITELENDICTLLKERSGLKGDFRFDWNTPFMNNIENYYGICYSEAV